MKKILTTLLAASMMLAGTSVFAQNLAVEAGFGLSSTRFNYTLGSTTADLYGGTLGLSYEISNIVIDARYNLGLTSIWDKGDEKHGVIQITLGYKFHL